MPLEFGVAFHLNKCETMSCDEAQLLIELLYLNNFKSSLPMDAFTLKSLKINRWTDDDETGSLN